MHKKIILFLIYSALFTLIIAPTQAQLNIQTIRLPELQPITAENISQLQLLGSLENFGAIAGRHATNFAISPNHQWLAVNVFGGILMYDLLNDSVRVLGASTDLGIGGFSNDSTLYVMPQRDGTVIYDTTSWLSIGVLDDGFVVHDILFSPDDAYVATIHEAILPGYFGEKSDGIYIFETTNWTQINRLPLNYTPHNFPLAFQSEDTLLHANDIRVYAWDYINIKNYANPDLPTKTDLLAGLSTNVYPSPDSPRYKWVGFINLSSEYALWLTTPEGDAIFAKMDGTYEFVTAGETGTEHDENGIPQTYGNYTRLTRQQNVALLQASDDGLVNFGTPNGQVVIINRSEASQTLPTFTYDSETNVLYNNQQGITYITQETDSSGVFTFPESDYDVQFAYRLDEYPVPDTIVRSELREDLYFTGEFSANGRYIFAISRNNETRRIESFIYDIDELVQLPIFDGLPELDLGYPFAFNATNDDKIAFITFINRSEGLFSQLQAWDIGTGILLNNFETDTLALQTILSDDGQLLVIGGGQVKDRIEFWGVPQS